MYRKNLYFSNLKNETISDYFNFFSGKNLEGLTNVRNEFLDLNDINNYEIVRLDHNIIQLLIYKEFKYMNNGKKTFVVAEMSFTIKKENNNFDSIKIMVLQSKPQFSCPPSELLEQVIKPGKRLDQIAINCN